MKEFPAFLANPFAMTITGGSLAILVGGLVTAPCVSLYLAHDLVLTGRTSLHSLDSTMSFILTLLTIALAYPTVLAFGHVLLQSAPPSSSTQMVQLRRALKEISADQRVLGTGTLRCWSIGATAPLEDTSYTALDSSVNASTDSSPRTSRFNSPRGKSGDPSYAQASLFTKPGEGTPLVISLLVHVHPDISDEDAMAVTRMAWSKLSYAAELRGSGGGGEVSVGIKRGWEGVE